MMEEMSELDKLSVAINDVLDMYYEAGDDVGYKICDDIYNLATKLYEREEAKNCE